MTVKQTLAKFGSRFAFEFFLEVMHDQIVLGLRKYLKDISVQDIEPMVKECRFPALQGLDFSAVTPNAEHIEKIDAVRLMECLAEARADLAEAIQGMGVDGAMYIQKLRLHLIHNIKNPEKELAGATEYKPAEVKMVQVSCDECKANWAVPKEEAGSITECPFCHKS